MKNTLKKLLFSTMSYVFKGTVFRENRTGDHKLAYDEQITKLLVFFNLLSAHMENTLTAKKA
jgi:hypothetical protein